MKSKHRQTSKFKRDMRFVDTADREELFRMACDHASCSGRMMSMLFSVKGRESSVDYTDTPENFRWLISRMNDDEVRSALCVVDDYEADLCEQSFEYEERKHYGGGNP